VCIDEAHSTVHNYESFRPEFKTAIETINYLVSVARRAAPAMIYVPILVMSATFTIADQHAFNLLIGRFPTIVFWGEMARRNITFNVQIAGQPTTSLMNTWTAIATEQPTKQSLIYSNSAAACDGQLLNKLSNAARKLPFNNGTFLSLTGDCGLMLKSFLMASFCGDTQTSSDASDDTNTQTADDHILTSDDTNTQTANDTDILTSLPRIWCMPCTSAANCGISSINCTTCFRVGPPPSWHEMVQEMGRVDRLHNSAHDGTNTYNIFLNVNTFISLWLRIHCESNVSVRDRQRDDLFQILRMLILPRQCYHAMVEQHFERPSTYDGDPTCNNNCSYCNGSYQSFCGRISKHKLISILTTNIFEKGSITAMSLVGMISSKANKRIKQAIWRGNTNVTAGNVHALVLMLLASNLISVTAPASSLEKRVPLKTVHFALTKEFASNDDEFETFALYIDSNWEGLPIDP
jgi:superfamily II DNA helicase RecQ